MDPVTMGIIAGGGAALGFAGDYFGAQDKEKMFWRMLGRQQFGVDEAAKWAAKETKKITRDPLFRAAKKFVAGQFKEGADNPTLRQFSKGLTMLQRQSGLRVSQAGAYQQAGALAAFQAQQRERLIPTAEMFASYGTRMRSQLFGQRAPIYAQMFSGTSLGGLGDAIPMMSPFSAGLTGGIQGAAAGISAAAPFMGGKK